MKVLKLTTGPVGTNVWIVGDVRTRESIAIDTATPHGRFALAEDAAANAKTFGPDD